MAGSSEVNFVAVKNVWLLYMMAFCWTANCTAS